MPDPAILNKEYFVNAHNEQRKSLHKLILTNTGWDALRSEASENLKQGNALSLKATNVEARIAFAETMHQEFGEYLDQRPELRIFWVTIAPNAAVTTLKGEHLKAIRSLKQTLFRLREFDYWGMIEPGYFPRGEFNSTGEKTVSWHAHLFVWVKSDRQAADLITRIEAIKIQNSDKLPSGLSATNCVEYRLNAILKRVWYACKVPLKQYSLASMKSGNLKFRKLSFALAKPLSCTTCFGTHILTNYLSVTAKEKQFSQMLSSR